MKIALINSCSPFVYGGAEYVVNDLKNRLIEFGHRAVLLRVPFPSSSGHKIIENILTCRLLNIDSADRVIAFKFPAFYVKHTDKIIWMFHQYRQVYELWNTEYGLAETPENKMIRDSVTGCDNLFLREAGHIYTNAQEVSDRLKKFNNIDSEVLHCPLYEKEKYYCSGYGDYLFFPSRINTYKRQHLAVEAMKYVKSGVRLIIAGKPDDEAYLLKINDFIRRNSLEERVKVIGTNIGQKEKIDMMAGSAGCVYIPFKEDSHGFVSMEAYYSKKAVIACVDSGGTDKLIESGVNGYLSEPEPESLADAYDKLYGDKLRAQKMGELGYEKLLSWNITWENVIGRLTR